MIEYRTGESFRTRKLPGLTNYANIVLKRGITLDLALWQWRKNIVEGKADRRNGSIVVLDEGRKDMLRFQFVEGWPCKWVGPTLNAGANEVAIETLEITHEGLELAG